MASSVAYDKVAANWFVKTYDHDPGGTSATLVSPDGGTTIRYLDMLDYECALVQAMLTVPASSSGITKLEIVASDAADFSTNVTVVKDSGTIDADAVGDTYTLECDASELAQLSSDGSISPGLRYIAGRLTCSNTGDEAVVTYVAKAKRPVDGVTAADGVT